MNTRPVSTGLGAPQLLRANCLVSDAVGDAVCITGDRVGDLYQVTRVDIDNSNPRQAIAVGVIKSKSSSTLCLVQVSGEMRSLYSGLTPNRPIFVGVDGRLTQTRPPAPVTGKRMLRCMGQALADDVLLISPWSPTAIVPV